MVFYWQWKIISEFLTKFMALQRSPTRLENSIGELQECCDSGPGDRHNGMLNLAGVSMFATLFQTTQ